MYINRLRSNPLNVPTNQRWLWRWLMAMAMAMAFSLRPLTLNVSTHQRLNLSTHQPLNPSTHQRYHPSQLTLVLSGIGEHNALHAHAPATLDVLRPVVRKDALLGLQVEPVE